MADLGYRNFKAGKIIIQFRIFSYYLYSHNYCCCQHNGNNIKILVKSSRPAMTAILGLRSAKNPGSFWIGHGISLIKNREIKRCMWCDAVEVVILIYLSLEEIDCEWLKPSLLIYSISLIGFPIYFPVISVQLFSPLLIFYLSTFSIIFCIKSLKYEEHLHFF